MLALLRAWLDPLVTFRDRWSRRVRLKIGFDPSQPYQARRVADHDDARGLFCHVMVRNDGQETARACRAWLMTHVDHRLLVEPIGTTRYGSGCLCLPPSA